MVKKKLEVYEETDDGPVYWRSTTILTPAWDGGAFFRLNNVRYVLGSDDLIYLNRKVVGRLAYYGKILFIGPSDAPVFQNYMSPVGGEEILYKSEGGLRNAR